MLQVSMASSVSRSDTNRLLTVGVLKIPDVWIPSIQSVGIERCDPPRDVMHTAGHSALCRCWICDTPSMCYPPRWWACGTHSAIINDLNYEFTDSDKDENDELSYESTDEGKTILEKQTQDDENKNIKSEANAKYQIKVIGLKKIQNFFFYSRDKCIIFPRKIQLTDVRKICFAHSNCEIRRQKERYAEKKNSVLETCNDEIKALFGILILSAAMKNNNLASNELFDTTLYGQEYKAGMSEVRFRFLLDCLRFDAKGTREERKESDYNLHQSESFGMNLSGNV
ncbi:DDE_Tnp_1_7 domain-containing protein [Nephila pilipes]|uniref:DDE_Tnp_1_7 domain-containing protein n=1 Tax=Nephila pilipes TaxID=299642 RepID=A0A8X6N3J6_NEPPI|nr:DDE_Tnp_1_7 domain-containing protein [Nephila pilipes]